MESEAPTGDNMCFVIMPFGDPFDRYYVEILKPAIREAGLTPVRGDETTRLGIIVNQVWTDIQQSKVCIADISRQNPNVMYELGLAHAIAKPVVPIAQDAKDLPFDSRHHRHFIYTPGKAGWEARLRAHLVDTLGIVMQGGYDLVLPRADLHAQFPMPDFSGLWEYRCAKAGKAKEYEHNGVCTFDVHVDEFGVSFKVLGERRWMIRDGVVNEQVLRWESNWGAVTAHDLVRFTYAVVGAEMEVGGETIEVQIQGYAYGHIRRENDRPVRIEGKFFQLAPVFSLHGNLFFRRMANEYDTIWADRSADEMKS